MIAESLPQLVSRPNWHKAVIDVKGLSSGLIENFYFLTMIDGSLMAAANYKQQLFKQAMHEY